MKKLAIAIASACLLTTGCAHPALVSPVEITRFTGDAPMALGRGTIAIAPAPGTDGSSNAYGIYADAVQAELTMLGYDVVTVNAEQTALLGFESFIAGEDRAGERGESPVDVGVGGSAGTFGSGVGVGVGINLNSLVGDPPETIARRLSLAIQFPARGSANLWEGRAQMSATSNSEFADESAAATRMVEALFTNFPGTSGETVTID